ncbi:C-type lectin domain protein precursor [Strongylocentrotus purpuratus]|uniref:C-type lectin domain protein n=1 Tax=Strongylocentrotus purpuratus TaxID=7668 RepID=Q8MUK9_STRPU|nr:C-type lectin domain protein precursor [Strongylocentrotus purpuratus]AAM70488.1 C-type lectin domain protein [Strongylocentrotus purpuratus]|eukprot:NP_999805.1 C-type lectin domain protein precursor [Strongylocentrotus purpuratus]
MASYLTFVVLFSVVALHTNKVAGQFYIGTQCSCPTFWTGYGNYCYRYFNDVKTWLEAEFYCRTFGAGGCMGQTGQAHLVSIHSQDENDFLFSYFDTVRNKLPPAIGPIRDERLWLGLTDKKQEGFWTWSDGTNLDYANWRAGEPNNNGGNEDYAQMSVEINHEGLWFDMTDAHGDYIVHYICKMAR